MKFAYEVFHRDLNTMVDFYVDALGFDRPSTSASDDHVVLRRNDVRVGCSVDHQAKPSDRRPPDGSEVIFWVDDIHAEYDRVVASGWSIADEIQTRPWGATDFRLFDPTGQYVRVSGAIQGA